MKLTIKITKEVLKRSMYCGTEACKGKISENCAIAVAVRDIFPTCAIAHPGIYLDQMSPFPSIRFIPEVGEFIYRFDRLRHCPEDRLKLPEFEFTVEVPDSIIDSIGIKEIHEIIERSETLELVEV